MRYLNPADLDAVSQLDAALTGHPRRAYFERRLSAALRQTKHHVQFGVEAEGRLAGYVMARRLEGEFGRTQPSLQLEAIGVDSKLQTKGLGRALLGELEAYAKRHEIPEIRTMVHWRDHSVLRLLDRAGYSVGRSLMIECPVHRGSLGDLERRSPAAPGNERPWRERDYSAPAANDYEALARDVSDIRSMSLADLPQVASIDRRISGHNREAYIHGLFDEAMNDSAVRVSLIARADDVPAGFIMARTDFGSFGRSEPAAVIDTLGVTPDAGHKGMGTALLSQLFANLQALLVEKVETVVAYNDLGLLNFFYRAGFVPSQRLAFIKRIG
ncbi:MAG: GNAT family N-acetyltransferase [Betaproteobacteria bacterium]|nr:GNAT family N-acetyltransferase [Betaproteobacteria bacterium]